MDKRVCRPNLRHLAFIIIFSSFGTLSVLLLSFVLKDSPGSKEGHTAWIIRSNSNLLEDVRNVHLPIKLPRKLIIVAYMRSGSTFVGSLFDNNPDACYWFEPLLGIMQHIYGTLTKVKTLDMTFNIDGTRRTPPVTELENYQYYLDRILSDLHPSVLPMEILFNRFTVVGSWTREMVKCAADRSNLKKFKQRILKWLSCRTCYPEPSYANLTSCYANQTYAQTNEFLRKHQFSGCYPRSTTCHRKCMRKLRSILSDCLKLADNRCGKRNITAMKTVRVSIAIVEGLIKKDPEVKVVHYVRDPRGVFSSRKKAGQWILSQASLTDWFTEIKFHCLNVMQNLRDAKRILSKYPGSIITVRYEDFAADPIKYANEIYQHVNLPLPDVIKTWVSESTNATRDNGMFGTNRRDSNKTAFKWKDELLDWEVEQINICCREVIDELGYSLMT